MSVNPTNISNKNDLKPHTNTLEAKTIRNKSWQRALSSDKRRPAVTLVIVGFLLAAILPAIVAQSMAGENDNFESPADIVKKSESAAVHGANTNEPAEVSNDQESAVANDSEAKTSQKSSTSSKSTSTVEISTSVESTHQSSNTSSPKLTIDGRTVDLPKNGTYRETINNEEGKVKIRAKVKSDNSSLNIKVNSSE